MFARKSGKASNQPATRRRSDARLAPSSSAAAPMWSTNSHSGSKKLAQVSRSRALNASAARRTISTFSTDTVGQPNPARLTHGGIP